MIGRVLAAAPHVLTPVESYLASIHSKLRPPAGSSSHSGYHHRRPIFSSCLATLQSAVFRPQSTVFSLQLNFKSQSNVAAERGMVRISFVADGGRRFVNNKQVECKLSVAVAREKQKTRLQQEEEGKNKIISGQSGY